MAIINIQPPAGLLPGLTARPEDIVQGKTAYGEDGFIVGSAGYYDGQTTVNVGSEQVILETENKIVPSDITINPPTSTDLTISEMGITYHPSDYGVDYFKDITTIRDNSLIKAFCENLPYSLTPANTQGVVSIRNYAFRYDAGLESIHLADTVTQLNGYCFAGTGVVTFDSGSGLADVADRAFDSNSKIETAYFHGNNTIIRSYAFNNCTKLKNVILTNVTELKSSLFYGDYRLLDVEIPATVISAGDYLFAVGTDITTVNNINNEFCVTIKRVPAYVSGNSGNFAVAPTKLGYNFMLNRLTNSTRKAVFVPWAWYLTYRSYNANANAGVWDNAGVWIEAAEGDTLPTTSHQTYDNLSADYTYTWYSDKALQNQVTIASTAGMYYGVITQV